MKRFALGAVVVVLAAYAVVLLLAGLPEPDLRQGAASAVAAPPPVRAPVVALPEGSLKPIIGDPREGDLEFCDAANWKRLDGLVVGHPAPATVVLDQDAWQRQGAAVRAGIASWISKCLAGGAPVDLHGDLTGERLGRYDAREGYRPAS